MSHGSWWCHDGPFVERSPWTFTTSISEPLLGVHSVLDSIRDNLLLPKHSKQLCRLVFELPLESLCLKCPLLLCGLENAYFSRRSSSNASLLGSFGMDLSSQAEPTPPSYSKGAIASRQRHALAEGGGHISSTHHRANTRQRTSDSTDEP